jgi:hypothetical protein
MTDVKKLKNGNDVITEYRGWLIGRGSSYGYEAEHPRKASHYASNVDSMKRIVRECEIGDIKFTKGTPTNDGAVFHYTTYRGESFTVRRRKLRSRVGTCWNVFPDAGRNKGRLVAGEERLVDVRYWLYSYQDSQMRKEERL